MARREVIEDVQADFAFNDRIAYRVTLSCGCSWWEHRPIGKAPPQKGDPALCHIDHHRGGRPSGNDIADKGRSGRSI